MKINIYEILYNERGCISSQTLVASFYNEELAHRVYNELVQFKSGDTYCTHCGYMLERVKEDK